MTEVFWAAVKMESADHFYESYDSMCIQGTHWKSNWNEVVQYRKTAEEMKPKIPCITDLICLYISELYQSKEHIQNKWNDNCLDLSVTKRGH